GPAAAGEDAAVADDDSVPVVAALVVPRVGAAGLLVTCGLAEVQPAAMNAATTAAPSRFMSRRW
ncbi:MAG: hypothetical protein QOG49_45, partial [Frankiaceae bacterium]|nr:hypothetical protein [Frankiaceae bacterium]